MQEEPKPADQTAQATGEKPAQQGETAEQQVARLTRERDEWSAKATEHEDNAKFWHERARRAAAKPAENRDGQQKPAEEQDETDLLELAGKGPAAMKAWLQKVGFVSREEAEALTTAKANSMVRQAQVVKDYPELGDNKSEFFKETTEEYARLKSEGVPELVAMETAAKLVGLKRAKPADAAGDKGKDGKGDAEAERKRRAAAQSGESRRGSAKQDQDDGEMDEMQTRIAEAFGITAEAYKKRAKEGVQFARQ